MRARLPTAPGLKPEPKQALITSSSSSLPPSSSSFFFFFFAEEGSGAWLTRFSGCHFRSYSNLGLHTLSVTPPVLEQWQSLEVDRCPPPSSFMIELCSGLIDQSHGTVRFRPIGQSFRQSLRQSPRQSLLPSLRHMVTHSLANSITH